MAKRKRGVRSSESDTNNGNDESAPPRTEEQGWSKSKKKHMRKILKMQKTASSNDNDKKTTIAGGSNTPNPRPSKNSTVSKKQESSHKNENPSTNDTTLSLGNSSIRPKSALQQAFLSRLAGSRFRELNEDLYTTNSSSAFERFQNNPQLFDQYHEGFREQVKSWELNPVDAVYSWIVSVNRQRERTENTKPLAIADFGCGDAKLAEKLLKIRDEGRSKKGGGKSMKKNKQGTSNQSFNVHSFDLVANGNPHITPCDMANVALKNGTVDIAVFVLALMGTNIADFIREAHRVLTPDGILKIAEVRSRFEQSTSSADGKKKSDDSILNEFLDVMKQLGFRTKQKDRSNKMFILLEFEKTGKRPSKVATFSAKPCIYKRR